MAAVPRLVPATPRRRLLWGAGLGLGVALLLLALRGAPVVEAVELGLVDARTRLLADERTPDPRIVIAQIEESDVDAVRRKLGEAWPWPLEFNAHLVNVLAAAGASALMVDILHLDRGAGPDDVPGEEAQRPQAAQTREIEAEGAAAYGEALRAFGRAALAFELSRAPRYELPGRAALARERLGATPSEPATGGPARSGAELPVRGVLAGAALLGFANVPQDPDGVARRAATFGAWGERRVLSLPLATARLATGADVVHAPGEVRLGASAQRLMPDDTFLLAMQDLGPRGGYARIPPIQLLDWAYALGATGSLPAEARAALEGRIVVLGVNLAGLKDVVSTPLGGVMDGPVLQAIALDNLLHGDGRVRAGRATNAWLLLALLVLAGALGGVLRGRWLPHLVPLALGGGLGAAALASFRAGVSVDLFTPWLGLVLAWGGTFALRAFTEGRRNRWLEGAFGRYMAPRVIEALKRDPARLELGGRTRRISVLFSDIAGFTRFSEALSPAQVVTLLNRYLTAHCAAVMDEEGVVDKFQGDAVMAFFGDPVEQPDHALRACRAALRVQRELPALAPLLAELGVGAFEVRVGLNTGDAVVGNMGSAQRFDYTCMGDTVNLASRLEGAAKHFGAPILVGGATAEAAGDAVLTKPLGRVAVVGRDEPVEVHELLATAAEASADLRAHARAFATALDAARAGDAAVAAPALDEAERLRPGDGTVAWLRGVLAARGGARWDGLTTLRRK